MWIWPAEIEQSSNEYNCSSNQKDDIALAESQRYRFGLENRFSRVETNNEEACE